MIALALCLTGLTGCAGVKIDVGETRVRLPRGTFGMVPDYAGRGNAVSAQSSVGPVVPFVVDDSHVHSFTESEESFALTVEDGSVTIKGPFEQWTAFDTLGDAGNRGIRNGALAWFGGKVTGLFKARDATSAATEQLRISDGGATNRAGIAADVSKEKIKTIVPIAEIEAAE